MIRSRIVYTMEILTEYACMLRDANRNTKAAEIETQVKAIRAKLGQEPEQTQEEN